MHPESTILGAFVWPGLFFGGVVGAAAPVIIHLLVRRRLRRVRWAAMDFLMDAQKRSRRRVQLEQLILLLLRCLAAVLLAALLARPFALPGGWGSWFGGIQRTERIIVLDDSGFDVRIGRISYSVRCSNCSTNTTFGGLAGHRLLLLRRGG